MRVGIVIASVSLFCLPLGAQIASHVVISEVGPMGGSSSLYNTGEFVELYNPTGSDVVFGPGVSLVSGNVSGTNAAEWQVSLSGLTIKAYGFLLIADGGIAVKDVAFPSSKNLANSGVRSCVQLRDGATVIDAFGWDPVNVPTLSPEGDRFVPSSTSSTHKSFERKSSSASLGPDAFGNGYDTNNNATDFFENDSVHANPQHTGSPTEAPSTAADTTGPRVLSFSIASATSILLQFNEAVDSVTASTAGLYAVTNGISVSAAVRQANISRVVLTVSTLPTGVYTLTVSGVSDTAGNLMEAPQDLVFSYGVIPIDQARALGAGAMVRVQGTVTVGPEFGSPAYLEDSTAGLAVFNNAFSTRARSGDVWEVAGTLKDYNGLLEIDPLTDSVLVSTGNPPPAATLMTSAGLQEANEGKLVRLDRVVFQATGSFGSNVADNSYTATDATGSFTVRIDRHTNIPSSLIPADTVNIAGVVGDFLGTYQLMPRSTADLDVKDPAPGQTWTDISVARSYSPGAIVRVRGIVTFNQTNNTTNTVYLQDATGGVALFSPATSSLQPGDSVEVRGTLSQFYGLIEITTVDSVWSFGGGHPLPEPIAIGIANAAEAYEGRLVRIPAVRFIESGLFSTASTTYHLSDGSSQLDCRVPALSPLGNSAIPAGAIDAIGVLGQYLSSYQLTPRSAADLVALPGPQIAGAVTVDSVFDDGFSLRWTTVLPGTTLLRFGVGESLTDSVGSDAATTDHSAHVSGLRPGRIYAWQAVSSDGSGTAESGKGFAVTTSPGSSGQISAYFNYPVDTFLPGLDQAEGGVDLGSKILERISGAARSIDLALYSFDDLSASATDVAQRIADSLIAAKGRGVKVRVVFQDRPSTGPLNSLVGAGIPVLKRTVPFTGSGMHNKFWVFDGRDTLEAGDDWVVTGSWNATDEGTYQDAQNALFIQDQSLAAIYTKEFEEMFGSSSDTPDAVAARFGPTKRDNTPHWTMVGGTKVESYFSPSDRTSAAITRSVGTAGYNVFFGLLTFTRDEIANMLVARKDAGVIVRGLIDNTNDSGSEFTTLAGAGIDVLEANHSVVLGQFHHKYGVVDPFHDASDPLVITGSHNWSTSADADNDENTLIVHSGRVAREYVREFSKRYAEAGGSNPVLGVEGQGPAVPGLPTLAEAYPNPFNGDARFEFRLAQSGPVRLSVFDILGREVAVLAEGVMASGVYNVAWSPRGVGSGLYVCRLRAGSHVATRKVVYIK